MPKRPPEPEFDIEEDDNEEGFEVDMDVVERIATALEAIAKVLTDREAKFAARPPRKDFGDKPFRPRRDDDGDDRPARGFSKPGYGEKTFRSGPGLGYSDRGARDGGKPAGKGFGRPGGKPAGKGAPRGRG